MMEVSGCIHLHTTYSDGSGGIADVAADAMDAGLDYLIVTDHHSLRPLRDGVEGYYGDTLLLVGTEVGRHKGHILALDVRRLVSDRPADTRAICRQVGAQGGLSFVAHPHAHGKRMLMRRDQSWKSPSMPLITGLEVWSWMYDWFHGLVWQGSYPSAYFFPERRIRGPQPETLRLWDRLSATRRCVGIGCLDAHAIKRPWLPGVTVFSYAYLFRTVRTHLWVDAWSGDAVADKRALYHALARGRGFFAHHGAGDARGFEAWLELDDGTYRPGDECACTGEGVLRVRAPARGEIRVLKDSQIISTVDGDSGEAAVSDAGVYRVEVRRNGRPWIFANPIRLAASASDVVKPPLEGQRFDTGR